MRVRRSPTHERGKGGMLRRVVTERHVHLGADEERRDVEVRRGFEDVVGDLVVAGRELDVVEWPRGELGGRPRPADVDRRDREERLDLVLGEDADPRREARR